MKKLAVTFASIAVASIGFSVPALAGETSNTEKNVPQQIAQSSAEKASTSEDLVERVKAVYAEICSKSRASATIDRTVVTAPEPPVPVAPAPRTLTPQLW